MWDNHVFHFVPLRSYNKYNAIPAYDHQKRLYADRSLSRFPFSDDLRRTLDFLLRWFNIPARILSSGGSRRPSSCAQNSRTRLVLIICILSEPYANIIVFTTQLDVYEFIRTAFFYSPKPPALFRSAVNQSMLRSNRLRFYRKFYRSQIEQICTRQ